MTRDLSFDTSRQQWDAYKRFHVRHFKGIVQFDTGELILTQYRYQPHERETHDRFGLRMVYPHDRCYHLKHLFDTENGRPVKQSWLVPQPIVLDFSTGQVFSLNRSAPRQVQGMPEVPSCFDNRVFYAYCGGAGREWVSTGRVVYSKPAKLAKEQKEELKDKLLTVKAQMRVSAIELHHRNFTDTSWPYSAVHYSSVLGVPLDSIPMHNRAVLAHYGYKPFRDLVRVDNLRIK